MTKNVMSQLFSIAAFVFASCVLCSCASEADKTIALEDGNKETAIPEKIDFTFHVKPILSDRCFICHGPDKNAVEGDLSLHSAEEAYRALGELKDHAAIVPGNAAKSSLVERIFSDDPNLIMPPPESNLVLEDFEKAILEKWIAQGAEYKTHWAFIPPTPQEVPENDGAKVWGSNEIDAFILNKLTEKGLSPSSRASSEKLLRRITFDLTGLPPTLEQIEKFAANPLTAHQANKNPWTVC